MKLPLIFFCLLISVCSGFNILDVIITKETMTKFKEPPRLRKDYLCWRSDYNLGTILKTFLATSSRPIDKYKNISRNEFCTYCRFKKHFDSKYTHHTRKDKPDNVLKELKLIVSMLDRECKFEWDRGSRGHNKETGIVWIEDWLTNKLPPFINNCSDTLERISVAHSFSGASKMAYMAAKASRVSLETMLSIALAVIHENMISKKSQTCFDLVNTFSYFNPDICTGQLGSIFQSSCPEACRLIEGRIVETTFNDCCNDCLGSRLKMSDRNVNKIDFIPNEKWSEVM
mgnify:CR=1 FL=1|tara:strand:- start:5008 stop:5865 length:858 start_codon:yes stop_codon:yes gene_type:complete